MKPLQTGRLSSDRAVLPHCVRRVDWRFLRAFGSKAIKDMPRQVDSPSTSLSQVRRAQMLWNPFFLDWMNDPQLLACNVGKGL